MPRGELKILCPRAMSSSAARDLQGFANQHLAWAADNVVFVIAGLSLRLKLGDHNVNIHCKPWEVSL
jgi:hypothetical protein